MAKRKKRTTNTRNTGKRKTNKKQQNKSKLDIEVVALFVLSILLAVLIYAKSGIIGENLNIVLGGIMGWLKYILPIGTFIMAIYMVIDEEQKESFAGKIINYTVFLICLMSIMTIYQISKGSLKISYEFQTLVSRAYELGSQNIGGGAIGAVIAIPASKLLGMWGAAILFIGIALINIVYMFRIKPAEMLGNYIKEKSEEKYANIDDEEDDDTEEIILKRAKKKAKKIKQVQEDLPMEDQITINLNNQPKKLKKYKHEADELIPLTKESKQEKEQFSPNHIEENLFKQEEEKKEDKVKEVLTLEHAAMTVEDESYEFPPVELLSEGKGVVLKGGKKALADTATKLQKTLYSFGVSAKVENVSVGPAITRYEIKPAEGVRVSKIANLADDIALNLAAESIRIEAPIPGKQAVGIEIPNKENEIVHLRDILETDKFQKHKSKLAFALGKDVAGEEVVADISKMPHVLIAGSTGSGKSVCINTLISSIIYKAKPSEVKLVMVDPKVVELSVYNGIPHLLIPVVTDPKKAAGALAWAVQEMENRYNVFASKGVRDLKGYNASLQDGEGKLPQIVIIIDELADLMMVAAKEVEESICRLAQKARAAGMHLVIATQRPSVDVITGLIKANVPSRIAFAVSSQIDSRTILDMVGAEKLLGKGDMLFYPAGASKPTRVQGAFVDDKEVEKIVDFLKANGGESTYNTDIIESIEKANTSDKEKDLESATDDETDPFLMEAIETVVETGQASTSFIQRRFKVGYARAGRIIDQMEERGIISGYQGSKPREVLMSKERWEELKMQTNTEENK
jgi:S-DNA-T family DNA segregation ATPase FtsK/SpoIIIE